MTVIEILYFVCAMCYPHVVSKCDWLKFFHCKLGLLWQIFKLDCKRKLRIPYLGKERTDRRVAKVTLVSGLHWQSSSKVLFQYGYM